MKTWLHLILTVLRALLRRSPHCAGPRWIHGTTLYQALTSTGNDSPRTEGCALFIRLAGPLATVSARRACPHRWLPPRTPVRRASAPCRHRPFNAQLDLLLPVLARLGQSSRQLGRRPGRAFLRATLLCALLWGACEVARSAPRCQAATRLDCLTVGTNLERVGFPPFVVNPADPAIFFARQNNLSRTRNFHLRGPWFPGQPCESWHDEDFSSTTSDEASYDPASGLGPETNRWEGLTTMACYAFTRLYCLSPAREVCNWTCSAIRTGPGAWSEPDCQFAIGAPVTHEEVAEALHISTRHLFNDEGPWFPRPDSMTGYLEEFAESRTSLSQRLSLSNFTALAQGTLGALPFPPWEHRKDFGSAERGGVNVVLVESADRARFSATLSRLKYRIAVCGRRGDRGRIEWIERFTPTGGGPVTDTRFEAEITFSGQEQFLPEVGGEDGRIVEPPPLPGRVEVLLQNDGSCPGRPCPGPGDGLVELGSINVDLHLGVQQRGTSAGFLLLRASAITPHLTSPAAFSGFFGPGVEVLRRDGAIRQVSAAQTLVDLATLSPDELHIRFFPPTSGRQADGLHRLTGTPLVTWTFLRPADAATNRFRVVRNEQGATQIHDFEWRPDTSSWILDRPGLGTETLAVTTPQAGNTRHERRTLQDPDGTLVETRDRTYARFDDPLGEVLLAERVGDEPWTTYRYFHDRFTDGAHFGRLREVIHASGYWERYRYSNGLLDRIVAPHLNAPPGTPDDHCRTVDFSYSPHPGSGDSGLILTNLPRLIVERLRQMEVSRQYRIVRSNEIREILPTQPGAPWNTSDAQLAVTRIVVPAGTTQTVESIRHPDGTWTLFAAPDPGFGGQTTTVSHGAGNGLAIADGTRTTSTLDALGRLAERIVSDIASGTVLSHEIHRHGERGDTTIHANGQSTLSSGCCGLLSSTDRDGTLTTFARDRWHRPVTSTRAGITHSNHYNAAGSVVGIDRHGSDATVVPLRRVTLNTAGREIRRRDTLGNPTEFHRRVSGEGSQIHTTTLPDGAILEEVRHRDGSLEGVRRPGVAVRFEYGLDPIPSAGATPIPARALRFVREIKLDADGHDTPEVTTTFYNALDQPIRLVHADGATEAWFYNEKGQLVRHVDADGIVRLFTYNRRGEPSGQGIDADGDGRLTPASRDRLIQLKTFFQTGRRVSEAHTWEHDHQETPTLLGRREEALNGSHGLAIDHAGAESRFTSSTDGAGGRVILREWSDGVKEELTLTAGRLTSLTRRDANGGLVARFDYHYDPHGRQIGATDSRLGTITNHFDAADRVAARDIPGFAGQPTQTTRFDFDPMGRPIRINLPDGTVVAQTFHPGGALRSRSEPGTDPAEYSYDSQGRLTRMRFGQAETIWNYDPLRGWLAEKRYVDGQGPQFGYTPGGRPHHRRDARGWMTWYTNDAAGDLAAIHHQDGNTPSLNFIRDRLGRAVRVHRGSDETHRRHNLDGNFLSESNQNPAISFEFDIHRRLRATTLHTQPVVRHHFAYDAASRLLGVSAGPVDVTFSYPAATATAAMPQETFFRFNGTLRAVSTREENALRQLRTVGTSGAAGASRFFVHAYDAAGRRSGILAEDGTRWSFAYDEAGRLKAGGRLGPDDRPVPGQQFEYAYDTTHNRLSARRGDGLGFPAWLDSSESFTLLNQSARRTSPGAIHVLGHAPADASVQLNGIRAQRQGTYFHSVLASTRFPSTSVDPVAIRVTNNALALAFDARAIHSPSPQRRVYDPEGNLSTDPFWSYRWDGENRLLAMTPQSATAVSILPRVRFTYDDLGRRATKTVDLWKDGAWQRTSETRFIWAGWQLLAELDGQQRLLRSYLWGPEASAGPERSPGIGGLLAVTDHSDPAKPRSCFFAYDGRGNVAGLIEAESGRWVARYEYGPFGELIRATGPLARTNPFRFSTRYQDDETGLIYFGYRYYDPHLGRWLSRDPIGEHGGANLYAFCRNEPVGNHDPLGLRAESTPRDLKRYRYCRRNAWISRLEQGGAPTGDLDRDCCRKLTILIKLPLCTAEGLEGLGLGGHTGIGIDDEFYDFGPDVNQSRGRGRRKQNVITGVPALQWWDEPTPGYSPDDIGLQDILAHLPEIARTDRGEPLDVFKIELAVSPLEAGRVRDYWRARYAALGTYSVLGSQCTTTVLDSLDRAGVFDRPLLTFSPIGFLRSLASARHTCGPNQGRRIRIERIQNEIPPPNCSLP